MCREPVPRNTGNDQVGTRPRNVRDGTSNGVATTFLFRGSLQKERVLARGPRETPIFFGRHRKRCGRAWKNAEGTRKIAEEMGKMQKTLGSVGSQAEVQGSQKSGRGHSGRVRVGRLGARMSDEAGRVGIRSDEKGKFVVPTN